MQPFSERRASARLPFPSREPALTRTCRSTSLRAGSLGEHNRFVIPFAAEPAEDVLLIPTLWIEDGFRVEVRIRGAHFVPPLLIALLHGLSECIRVRRVGEFEIRKSGQGLQRFPGIETDCG